MDELQKTFISEAEEILEQLENTLMNLENNCNDEDLTDACFRLMHHFTGSSRSVGFDDLSILAHHSEDLLSKIKNKKLTNGESCDL